MLEKPTVSFVLISESQCTARIPSQHTHTHLVCHPFQRLQQDGHVLPHKLSMGVTLGAQGAIALHGHASFIRRHSLMGGA